MFGLNSECVFLLLLLKSSIFISILSFLKDFVCGDLTFLIKVQISFMLHYKTAMDEGFLFSF